jgi:hypothetical protein
MRTLIRFSLALFLFIGALGMSAPATSATCLGDGDAPCCCGEDSKGAQCGETCNHVGANSASITCEYDEDGCIVGYECTCYFD